MFFYAALVAAALGVGYIIRLLFVDTESAEGASIDDFLKDPPPEANAGPQPGSDRKKYCTKYCEEGRQILILFGTEYGFSEELAKKLFDRIVETHSDVPLQPRILNAKYFEKVEFDKEQLLLCVFSTCGDGAVPTDARQFMDWLDSAKCPDISHIHYSVLALGDSNYPHYCACGKKLDARLSALGAKTVCNRIDVDQEDASSIEKWFDQVLRVLPTLKLDTAMDYLDLSADQVEDGFSKRMPYSAKITVKYPLTVSSTADDRETVHLEFDISESGLNYTCGDAIGVYPLNNPSDVSDIMAALHVKPDHQTFIPSFAYQPVPTGTSMSLKEALLQYYDLKALKPELVQLIALSCSDSKQKERGQRLLAAGHSRQNQELTTYISERELIDVVQDFSSFTCSVDSILQQLRGLQPRYYSVASSPSKGLNAVCVCAAVVRYSLLGKPRSGVCTTHFQDRVSAGERCPVFISRNPDFRLPQDGSLPIIMIGPGTGIAPFRAFIQERVLTNASGETRLYFGCRHRLKDFLYREELVRIPFLGDGGRRNVKGHNGVNTCALSNLHHICTHEESWSAAGKIVLRTAFSRDQAKKVYVQDLIIGDGATLWQLIEKQNAHIYVCGDASNMAKDVHTALLKVFVGHGGLSESQATEYLEALGKKARYERDVWVT